MNFRHTIGSLLLGSALPCLGFSELTVHEWGTFTSVHASDGTLLSGLEREEHRLPGFVRSHLGFAPADKGWSRPVKNVTIKMETPVLYFYAEKEMPVTVDVGFNGGSISQWYPERSGGEKLPISTSIKSLQELPPMDFAQGYTGRITWDALVLASGSNEKITANKDWETPQWPRARVAEANRVRTPDGAVEGFLFYRGIGRFEIPFNVIVTADGALRLHNSGAEKIPFVWVYDNREQAGGRYAWEGSLGQGEVRKVEQAKVHFGPERTQALLEPLQAAGITEAEARAMLATWQESYFDAPGLRVFWIVPRAFTDRILPLTITPAPDKLERVLVGRSEVLTPAFERELADGFRKDGGVRWTNDRYFLAYRERARQLGVVLSENSP
ncbi:MAG: hypothetical protein H7Y06_09940 [Opitutaceae bacterium]|nr:hypothetical protein [Opitutaceae bacterium]